MRKHILSLVFLLSTAFTTAFAGEKEGGIKWMTMDEVQVAMQKEPRRVIMDVYTDWCGWCKVMDKKTFTNPELIDYVNKHFYAVKFNAETTENIRFGGKMWGLAPGTKTNSLAVEMVRGQMSYPTTVILEPGFQNPQPIPGYLDVPTMEVILHYFVEDQYSKKVTFVDYQKAYKPGWKVLVQ